MRDFLVIKCYFSSSDNNGDSTKEPTTCHVLSCHKRTDAPKLLVLWYDEPGHTGASFQASRCHQHPDLILKMPGRPLVVGTEAYVENIQADRLFQGNPESEEFLVDGRFYPVDPTRMSPQQVAVRWPFLQIYILRTKYQQASSTFDCPSEHRALCTIALLLRACMNVLESQKLWPNRNLPASADPRDWSTDSGALIGKNILSKGRC